MRKKANSKKKRRGRGRPDKTPTPPLKAQEKKGKGSSQKNTGGIEKSMPPPPGGPLGWGKEKAERSTYLSQKRVGSIFMT